jgi:hypothetical protein
MYASLPEDVQIRAKRAYQLFQRNPGHPGLNFKKVDDRNDIYSARVGLGYRAVGQMDGEDIVWFWIGPTGNTISCCANSIRAPP